MALRDDLENGLAVARRALFTLAPRPDGDPEGLRQLAARVRVLAEAANASGRADRDLPGSMVFKGPGAKRFAGNAEDVSESLFVAGRRLDDIADRLITEAAKIHKEQTEHDRLRSGLEGQVSSLLGRLGGLDR